MHSFSKGSKMCMMGGGEKESMLPLIHILLETDNLQTSLRFSSNLFISKQCHTFLKTEKYTIRLNS